MGSHLGQLLARGQSRLCCAPRFRRCSGSRRATGGAAQTRGRGASGLKKRQALRSGTGWQPGFGRLVAPLPLSWPSEANAPDSRNARRRPWPQTRLCCQIRPRHRGRPVAAFGQNRPCGAHCERVGGPRHRPGDHRMQGAPSFAGIARRPCRRRVALMDPELRCDRRRTPARTAVRASCLRAQDGSQFRPAAAPRITHNNAPTGNSRRTLSQGSSASHDRGRDRRCRRPPAQIPACASTHWAPPSGSGVEALLRPGVQDAGLG